MNQLLPIIRRVRRPLLVADVPPLVVGSVEPVEVGNIEHSTLNLEPRTGEKVAAPLASVPPQENSDAKTAANKRKAQ